MGHASQRESTDHPSETVVLAVARATDTDPLALPPLYEAVDPDALDAFVENSRSGSVTFDWDGVRVTVDVDGTVDVRAGPTGSASEGRGRADP